MSNHRQKPARIAGTPLEPISHSVARNGRRDGLRSDGIGQSAAEPLSNGEGSTANACGPCKSRAKIWSELRRKAEKQAEQKRPAQLNTVTTLPFDVTLVGDLK